MAGCSVERLWLDCFSLDGEMELDELTDVLAGERSLDRKEHNVVAAALNERFADAGFGNPVDYWEQVHDADGRRSR